MSSSAVRAGKAEVEIGVRNKLDKGLKAASARLKTFAKFAGTIGTAIMGAGSAVLSPFAASIAAASEFEETLNKFNVVFDGQQDAVRDWGKTFGNEIGRSENQILAFMANTQDLLVPLGFEPGAATAMSKQLTQLSIDLASFNNLQDEDVLRDLHAALTGSGEVMKKYGVVVSEAAVQQQLLNMSLDPKAATEAQKAQARLALIMAGTTAAQGDALRSSGSWANQSKALRAKIADLSKEIGTAILPTLTKYLSLVVRLAGTFGEWIAKNQGVVRTVALIGAVLVGVGGAILGISVAALGASYVFSGLAAGLAIAAKVAAAVGSAVAFLASPFAIAVAAIGAATAAFFLFTQSGQQLWGTIKQTLGAALAWVRQVFGGIYAAVAAGDLGLAASIAWEAVKVAVATSVDQVKAIVAGLLPWLSSTASELGTGIMSGLSAAWEWIKSSTAAVGDWIAGAFSGQSVSGPLSGLLALFGQWWDGIRGGASAVADFLSGVFARLQADAGYAASAIAAWFADAWQSLSSSAAELPGQLGGIWAAIVSGWTRAASGLQSAWSAAVSYVADVWAGIPSVLSGIWDWIVASAAAVAAPVLSVFQGIVSGLVSYFASIGEALSGVFGWLGEMFAGLAAGAKETFGGIIAAIANGDWAGAANIAWLSIKLAWQTGVAEVSRIWDEFTTGLMIGMDSAIAWISDKFAAFTGWMAKQLVKLWGLFDTDLQVDAVIQTIAEDTQRKRDQIKAELEGRNGARAAQLSKDLAETDAQLAELRAARQAALDASGAESGPGFFESDANKLAGLLDRAAGLADTALAGIQKPPSGPQPNFDPGEIAVATAGGGSSPIGTFDVRGIFGMFGTDAIDKQQLSEAQRSNTLLAEISRSIQRQRAVYGA